MKEIRLKLAQEESADLRISSDTPHETTPSAFLHLGLELEEQQ